MNNSTLRTMMAPKSIAIIGMSQKPGGVGLKTLQNLKISGYEGGIYLIGRVKDEVEGIAIHDDIGSLPMGVDLAVLAVPASGVGTALEGCISRGVRSAVIYASGFAEMGEAARKEQERIGKLARDAGMIVAGPNCLGFMNFVTGLRVGFVTVEKIPRIAAETNDAVAIVAQSGGIQSHLYQGLTGRGIGVSYSISTGNEMDLGLGDLVTFLLDEPSTRVIALYAEQIAQPQQFIASVREARRRGKPILLLHPGRSEKAQEAAQSHTGSLTGDYAVMRTMLEREGVVFTDTLDELLDVAEVAARFPLPPSGGLGLMTASGGFCGLAHDFCDELGIDIPDLTDVSVANLTPQFPAYIPPRNPLDLGTQLMSQTSIVGVGLAGLLADANIGAVVPVLPAGMPEHAAAFLEEVITASAKISKPVALVMLGDVRPMTPEFLERARASKLIVSRAPDRTIRAMGKWLAARQLPPAGKVESPRIVEKPYFEAAGTQVEWRGKQLLASIGVPVPDGALATTADEAVAIARRVGFPVAMKVQACQLAHKTEAGAVLLKIRDESAVRSGFSTLHENLQNSGNGGVPIDGVLVERMARPGVELVVGGKRDLRWGPVLLVGIGGVLVEALSDVRLLAADASLQEISRALCSLRGAKLLSGFRNMPAVNTDAIAEVVQAVGRLMLEDPSIVEIDINPLMASGDEVMALDALFIIQ